MKQSVKQLKSLAILAALSVFALILFGLNAQGKPSPGLTQKDKIQIVLSLVNKSVSKKMPSKYYLVINEPLPTQIMTELRQRFQLTDRESVHARRRTKEGISYCDISKIESQRGKVMSSLECSTASMNGASGFMEHMNF